MQYIDKNIPAQIEKAYRILDDFIEACWSPDNEYVNLNYETLRGRRCFVDLLVDEQEERCCYCMRRLHKDKRNHITLEHTIPQSLDGNLECFDSIECLSPDRVKRIEENKIDRKSKLLVPPYPHTISYENLVASCDGEILIAPEFEKKKLHELCNTKRGTININPPYFRKNIESVIKYQKDGTLFSLNDPDYCDSVIKTYNLHEDILVFCRRVWSKAAEFKIQLENIILYDNADEIDLFGMMLMLGEEDRKKLKNPNVWKYFLDYDWFYGYFSHVI